MSNEDRITEANNQGQADAASADSTSFADFLGGLMTLGGAGNNQNYNPPSDPDEKAAYDAGYDNARK